MDKDKVVVVYSGGLDSTVLLTYCQKEYDEVVALNFNYGSKHNERERESARLICKKLRIPLFEYDIPLSLYGEYDEKGLYHPPGHLLKSNLLELGGNIPEGSYNEENMKSTVVPFRNGIMLSLATGFAESRGFNMIAIANHTGDHAIYLDCREEFIEAIHKAIVLGTENVALYAPFTNMTKREIVLLGKKLDAPLELTWSCYCPTDKNKPCGVCSACIERNKVL